MNATKKEYTLSFAESLSHVHALPERTAYQNGTGLNFDKRYKVFSSREFMAHMIRKQQQGPTTHFQWIPVVKLSDLEGY